MSALASTADSTIDPDDTLPGRPSEPPPPPEELTPEQVAARIVDRRARDLAEACAGWRQRGVRQEDLVAVVCDCSFCGIKVLPRREALRRLPRGPVATVLARTPPQPGRLTVAACGEGLCVAHHVALPENVEAPDTRGALAPLSPERRKLLDLWLWRGRGIGKELRKYRHWWPFDELVVSACPVDGVRRAGLQRDIDYRRWPGFYGPVPSATHVAAARFDIWPGRVLVLLGPGPSEHDEDWSAEWVDPRRFGFTDEEMREEERRCFQPRGRYVVVD